ncbi:MAG: DegV family EDD domain-containing protein [Ruminococcaceae bacterium]|jgi:DegV family protein with EDD domain|nr:DegV family EDD domain-containing protein [Oscillospiraceae bacterium]
MNPKKWMQRLLNSERDIQERLFLLMTIPALIALLMMFLIELIAGVDRTEKIILGASFLVFSLITVITVRRNRLRTGADSVAFLLTFVMLPLGFFRGGGVFGGSPIWFVFAMVFVSMVVPGKSRYFFQTGVAVAVSVCYWAAYTFPYLIDERTDSVVYHNSLISVLLAGVLISMLASFEIAVYRTESKRSQAQREEIDQFIKSQNQFFSNMSHEIRTPINTIIGLNEMILREDISDEVAEDAANIQAASQLLLHLINDILDMSKIESGKMELVNAGYDVAAMLSDIVGMLWIRAQEKGLEFHVNVDPTLPAELYGDEVRIKQILINVLTNAVKYTREGSVTMSIQCRRQNSDTVRVTYSITDTGMGIKKENIPHLFSAFRRVDEQKNRHIEGTGLGLSIVKQLVDLMGGNITVNSVYTKGSTFIIEIPQKIASEQDVGEVNLEMRHAMNHRAKYSRSFEAPEARVLVVDDDATNRLVATKLLRETQVNIDTAESGAEALRKTYETRYHVILMDHMMPEMDGVECLRAIRAQVGGLCRESKVILLTANAGSEERELCVKEGFDGYLVKPVNGEDLEREVRQMLPPELVIEQGGAITLAERLGAAIRQNQKKLPLLITTDSVCGIPRRETAGQRIDVIPVHIHTEDGVFLDGLETETRGVLEYMSQQRGEMHTEPPGVEEYEEFFARALLRATNIIHISLSSGIGGDYAAASGARQTFGNATVVDSGQVCCGTGLLVLAAEEMAQKGVGIEQILQELERIKPSIHTSFIVSDTDYLARSGRMSHVLNKMSNAFLLHPMLAVKRGRLSVRRVYVGTESSVWRRYIASALRTSRPIDKKRLFIAYAGLTDEELREIGEEIKRRVDFEEVIFRKVSPAIAVNCGPRAFGLAYRTVD